MQQIIKQIKVLIPLTISALSFSLVMLGCAYLNGDSMWLASEEKEVVIRSTFPTLWDTEYSIGKKNLPFCFKLYGCHEFMHIGHSHGAPDYSKGGNITNKDILRFSIGIEGQKENVEFLITNGILQVVSSNINNGHLIRLNGLYANNREMIDVGKRWHESVLGKSVTISVWNYGCSIMVHNIGEKGVVYNYYFSANHNRYATLLIIYEIGNLRWFHGASL